MTYFLDTSALVKIYHVEQGSAALRALCDCDEALGLSDLSRLEFVSATARRFRDNLLDRAALERVMVRFSADLNTRYRVIRISQAIIDEATQILANEGLVYPLRSLDAIQFGTYRTSCQEDARFVSADKRLLHFAHEAGHLVLYPIEE